MPSDSNGGHADDRGRVSVLFVRDVYINVIANLIAAAIIYLLGAMIGILPGSAGAVGLAGGLLLAVLGCGLIGLGYLRKAAAWASIGFILAGVGTVLFAGLDSKSPLEDQIMLSLTGLGFAVFGVGVVLKPEWFERWTAEAAPPWFGPDLDFLIRILTGPTGFALTPTSKGRHRAT